MSKFNKIREATVRFVKKEVVLSIAIVATVITIFFVPIDK